MTKPAPGGTGFVESVPGRQHHDTAPHVPEPHLALFDVGLARRRAAAVRLPPLEDGRRDPVMERTSFTADRWASPRVLHVEKGSRHTAWLHGGRLKQLCERADVPHLYDHNLKTWRISIRRVDDLIVYADHVEGRFVTVETVDR